MSFCKGTTLRGNPCKCRVKLGKNFCHYHINSTRELINWDNKPDTFYPISLATNFPSLNEVRSYIVYKEHSLQHLQVRINEILFYESIQNIKKIMIISELVLVHRDFFIKNNNKDWIGFIEMCMTKILQIDSCKEFKRYHDNFQRKLHYTYRLEYQKKYIEFIFSKSEYRDVIINITSFL